MVSEPVTGRCAGVAVKDAEEEVGSRERGERQDKEDLGAVPHRLDKGTSASEDAVPKGGVDCDVPHWLGRRTNGEQITLYKGVETFP